MKNFCIAMLIAFSVPSLAMAGGGNSKSTGTITFRNTTVSNAASARTLFVIVGDNATLARAQAGAAAFAAEGGVTIPPGGSATFSNLRAGTQQYAFATTAVGGAQPVAADFAGNVRSVHLGGGQARTINLP